jgi:hypothetical protein
LQLRPYGCHELLERLAQFAFEVKLAAGKVGTQAVLAPEAFVFPGFAQQGCVDLLPVEQLPLGAGSLRDQAMLFVIFGRAELHEPLADLKECLPAFNWQSVAAGVQAVSQAVHAADGLAFGRPGTGGLLGIAAIGLDLFFGCHGLSFR